ncbi:hypothetical protein [Bifidobacterium oedipodis]|uniref:hypothetical protein n=1 Tax=Bifidobacterium oedipodis TaxID=2675322 RepID=UPI00145DA3F2|nr:hypothetical protein [Bifidobacterium sp. DSM 109957]
MDRDIELAESLLGGPRFRAYLDYASGNSGLSDPDDVGRLALELYRWNVRMSSVVMGYVSYVEVLVRNAIDARLCEWIRRQSVSGYADWIDVHGLDPLGRIRRLVNGDGMDHLAEAMQDALRKQRQWKADSSHPRHDDRVNRDDVFTQLSFGAWDGMLRHADGDPELADVLMSAFPNIEAAWAVEQARMPRAVLPGNPSDSSQRRLRLELVCRLRRIRKVRNRAGHQENLLRVEFPTLRRDMFFVLSALGPECLHWALPDRALALKEADPMKLVVDFKAGRQTRKEI